MSCDSDCGGHVTKPLRALNIEYSFTQASYDEWTFKPWGNTPSLYIYPAYSLHGKNPVSCAIDYNRWKLLRFFFAFKLSSCRLRCFEVLQLLLSCKGTGIVTELASAGSSREFRGNGGRFQAHGSSMVNEPWGWGSWMCHLYFGNYGRPFSGQQDMALTIQNFLRCVERQLH